MIVKQLFIFSLILMYFYPSFSYGRDLSYLSFSRGEARYQLQPDNDIRKSNRLDVYTSQTNRFSYGFDTGFLTEYILAFEVFLESSSRESSELEQNLYSNHYGTGMLFRFSGVDINNIRLLLGVQSLRFMGKGVDEVKTAPFLGIGFSFNHRSIIDFFRVMNSAVSIIHTRLPEDFSAKYGSPNYDIFIEGTSSYLEVNKSRFYGTATVGFRYYYE